MKKVGEVLIAIVALFFIIKGGYGIYTALNNKSSSDNSTKSEKNTPTLVSDELTTEEFGTKCIVGTIENNTNKDYSYAQVEFNLYDEEGNLIGSAMDNINNFKAGTTWKYKAVALTTEEFSTYEFIEITGW